MQDKMEAVEILNQRMSNQVQMLQVKNEMLQTQYKLLELKFKDNGSRVKQLEQQLEMMNDELQKGNQEILRSTQEECTSNTSTPVHNPISMDKFDGKNWNIYITRFGCIADCCDWTESEKLLFLLQYVQGEEL